jgi:lipopolysaccharide export system protein LptA
LIETAAMPARPSSPLRARRAPSRPGLLPADALTLSPVARPFSPRRLLSCALLFLAVTGQALAEKADADKPINIEADRMVYDDQKQISTFTGRVVLTKGTIEIRGDRLEVRQDPEGWQSGTAWGEPATFRQKREAVEEWVEGRALQIDYNGQNETVILQQKAMMQRTDGTRVLEEIHGSTIRYESGSELFTAESGRAASTPTNPSGRVRMVIQPRQEAPASPPGPATRLQPAERLTPGAR